MSAVPNIRLPRTATSLEPAGAAAAVRSRFADEVLAGLARRQKSIPSTWLHDARGTALLEQMGRLPGHCPTRSERWILERCAREIAPLAGRGAVVVEPGSGPGRPVGVLLDAFDAPAACVPIDVAAPSLPTLPACGRRVVFLPVATLGRFGCAQAVALLDRLGRLAGPDALLVAGVDATRDPAVLLPAHGDAAGVTAAFALNLLLRINRELGADFDPTAFRHEARWNAAESRVETLLVSLYTQRVTLLGRSVRFALGESVHVGDACKYGVLHFQAMARRAGWCQRQLWTDGLARMAVHVVERAR